MDCAENKPLGEGPHFRENTMSEDSQNKRNEEEQVDLWIDCVRGGKPLPTASADRVIDSPGWWKPENVNPEVESAISGFMASKTALAELGDDDNSQAGGVGVLLQLAMILEAIPEHCVNMAALDSHKLDSAVWVSIEDLYAQLSRGSVQVSVARLVFGVPVDLVTSYALRDEKTIVMLPLKAVVESLGDAKLMAHVPQETYQYETESLPVIFETREEQEAVRTAQGAMPEEVSPEATTPPEVVSSEPEIAEDDQELEEEVLVEAELAPQIQEDEQGDSVVSVQSEQTIQEAHEPAGSSVGGLDLNSATVEQLASLDGISAGIARDIVQYRNETGPFKNIFDLGQVPGVGRRRFRRITGMAFSRAGTDRRDKLARLLEIPVESISHLPSVARAIASRPGLQGCVISDKDGFLLSESGIGDDSRRMSAIVPRMISQIRENMSELDHEDVDTASISMRGRLLTVIDSGDVYLSVMHESNRLTSGMLKLVRRLAGELEWLLSYRGYISDPEAGSDGAGGNA